VGSLQDQVRPAIRTLPGAENATRGPGAAGGTGAMRGHHWCRNEGQRTREATEWGPGLRLTRASWPRRKRSHVRGQGVDS